MSTQKIEVRLNEKEAAHYFSNAAALYVLGMGFGYFAIKAQTPFMTGVCFWFSVYLLCDCFRLARVCGRLEKNNNVLLVADEKASPTMFPGSSPSSAPGATSPASARSRESTAKPFSSSRALSPTTCFASPFSARRNSTFPSAACRAEKKDS
ncbi:MAG: hypothetical protein ACXWSD_18065 [Bdellovibrionota bacterium]